MAKKREKWWGRLTNQFEPQLHDEEIYRNLPDHEADDARMVDGIHAKYSKPVDEGLEAIRRWTSRGLSGGLVSSLTLVGSQALIANVYLSLSVQLMTMTFILGLAMLFFRQILVTREAELIRKYAIDAHHGRPHYMPPLIYGTVARLSDDAAVIFLALGVMQGLWIIIRL